MKQNVEILIYEKSIIISKLNNYFADAIFADSNANHFWDKTRILAKFGFYREIDYFAKALSFNPGDVRRPTIAEELLSLYTRWGRFSDAVSCLDSIIQVHPSQRVLEKKARIATLPNLIHKVTR